MVPFSARPRTGAASSAFSGWGGVREDAPPGARRTVWNAGCSEGAWHWSCWRPWPRPRSPSGPAAPTRQPQAGIAPPGAASTDAGVTNGAVSYATRDLLSLMSDRTTQQDRLNAASRAAQATAGKPAPPPPQLDPLATPDYFGGPPTGPTARCSASSSTRCPASARRRPTTSASTSPSPSPTPPRTRAPTTTRSPCASTRSSCTAICRRPGCAATCSSIGAPTRTGRTRWRRPPSTTWGRCSKRAAAAPVRIKFVNELPAGNAGKLFLPVDATVPGAGAGPLGGDQTYPQNRASLHLHGGLTPWISGGSPYQWVTPAGERSPYGTGTSLTNVPDMWFDAGAGRSTRARGHQRPGPGRHDAVLPQRPERPLPLPARRHLRSHPPQRLRGRGGAVLHRRPRRRRARRRRHDPGRRAAPHHRGQDVRPRARTAQGAGPDLGPRPLGRPRRPVVSARLHAQPERGRRSRRQRQGTLGLPPLVLDGLRPHGERPGGEPPLRDRPLPARAESRDPQPLSGAERLSRHRTRQRHRVPLRQGRAQGLPAAHPERLRRPSSQPAALLREVEQDHGDGPGGTPELQTDSGEVPMLAAVGSAAGGQPATWPTDGRAGGVPDPGAIGPTMIQIGNDGGLLPQAVPLPNTPVGLVLKAPDPRDPSMGDPVSAGISGSTLFLAPGERADVIVDFSQVPRGSKLILYNDAPAPAPNGDSRVDYYTGNPDLTSHRGRAQHRRGLRTEHAHDPAVPGRRRRLATLRPRAAAARPAGRLCRLPRPDPRPRGALRCCLRRR